MAIVKFTARVEKKEILTPKFYRISFKIILPPKLDFLVGQYLSLQIDKNKLRHYSINSRPQDLPLVKICVDVSPRGQGSTFVKKIKKGDLATGLLPLGSFSLANNSAKSLFIATGSGISPIMPMLVEFLKKNPSLKTCLFWGLRKKEDIFDKIRLAELKKSYPNFNYWFCLSQEKTTGPWQKGRVTKIIDKHFNNLKDWQAYICGGQEMVKEARQLLIKKGLDDSWIYMERFF